MGSVGVVTDSASDLGSEAAAHGIAVVPLSVSFGDETFEDGVTIDSQSFYRRLASGKQRPTTSQPTPGIMEEAYRRALAGGADSVVGVHLGSKLSGTYSVARTVAEQLRAEGARIELVDSGEASLGMWFGVLAAAQAARDGGSAEQVAAAARAALARTTIYVMVDDLGYLQRGGRIGQAQALMGTLLNVKPIVSIRDGAVVPLDKPRTRRRAFERLAEYVREQAPVEAVVVGQSSPALGDELEGVVRQVYDGPISRMWAGPTIGTHVGPGAAGLAVLRAKR
jgi:DegV family protein with EDD domain